MTEEVDPGTVEQIAPEVSDVDYLGRNDNKEPETPAKETTEIPAEKEPEIPEEEPEEKPEEEKPEDKEEPEPEVLPGQPSFKEINEKFPGLFKAYPDLRHMYFRDQKIREAGIETVEDAHEMAAKSRVYDNIEASMLQGNPDVLLSTVAKASPEAIEKFSGSVLGTLFNLNPKFFATAITPVMKNALKAAKLEAKANGNNNLLYSVDHIAKYLQLDLNKEDAPRPTRQASDPEKDALKRELNLRQERDFVQFDNSINEEIRTGLVRRINSELKDVKFSEDKNIDKELKEAFIEKAIVEAGMKLQENPTHMNHMNALYSRAKRDGLSAQWKSRIVSAYLGGAFQHLKTIRGKFVKPDATEPAETQPRKLPQSGGLPKNKVAGKIDPRKVDWRKTSDEAFLSRHDNPSKVVMKS